MSRCCAASGSFPVKDVPGHDEDRQPSPNPSNAITVRSAEIMVFAGCSACLAGRLIWLGRVLRIWWPAHSRWHEKIRAVVSALDELIVGLDAAILVEDEDLQAGSYRCAAVGGNHLPSEFDDVAKTVCVVPRLEGELPWGDEFLMGAGHPHFKFVVPAGFEDG